MKTKQRNRHGRRNRSVKATTSTTTGVTQLPPGMTVYVTGKARKTVVLKLLDELSRKLHAQEERELVDKAKEKLKAEA